MKTLPVLATSLLLTFGAVAPSVAATKAATAETKATAVTKQAAAETQAATQIDINQAITIAKKNAQGKLKSVEYDQDDSEYEVVFASPTNKYEVKVDSRTGKVNSSEEKRIDADDKEKYQTLNSTKIDLTEAMQIAARDSKGQVIDAEFDIEDDRPVYEIKMVQNGEKHEINVDANSGEVVKSQRDS
ncbi:PepSY domain-containing protein [Psychrobacter sp. FDAARGOS_221]|uniref:PepSY domain-containing protein n=1 Tax=Psychrobacter sp. FDAARGOS_221 TaxID=1975705 RepID=UPI000BB57F79|nr:PepSY domain-containing protein [Psychrobacter sp. FDAARGOS_221]PNK61246.1 peptidase [Psychrobacter sp. FDAARGOS_221]